MTVKKLARIVFMIAIVCWFVSLIFIAATTDFHKYSNVIVCESDLIQTCKTYKHVEVLDSTVNHIVIKDRGNIFTLKGRIFNYE